MASARGGVVAAEIDGPAMIEGQAGGQRGALGAADRGRDPDQAIAGRQQGSGAPHEALEPGAGVAAVPPAERRVGDDQGDLTGIEGEGVAEGEVGGEAGGGELVGEQLLQASAAATHHGHVLGQRQGGGRRR